MAIIQLSGPTNSTTASGSTDLFPITLFGAVKSTTGSGAQTLQSALNNINSSLDAKVQKSGNLGPLVYGRDSGSETIFNLSNSPSSNNIPLYNSGGRIQTNTPIENTDTVNLEYLNTHMPSGVFNVTSLFSGNVTSGNYIVENIPNTYKAYIVKHTAGSSGIIKYDVIYVGDNIGGNHSFIGAYSTTSGATYVGEIQIFVSQDATKRSLYFYQATTLPEGYGVVTITNVWGVTW